MRRARLALIISIAGCATDGAESSGGTASAEEAVEWARWPMPNPAVLGLPNPQRYAQTSDGSVLDEVTGLTWQRTLDPRRRTRETAASLCAELGGGWRLPTAIELISLVDFARPSPTIDAVFESPLDYFWSSTPLAADASRAWLVYFGDGHASDGITSAMDRVRCVSGSYGPAPVERYHRVADGVTDGETGLTWQEPIAPGSFSYELANAHCATLGSGFRLPSMKELQSLVDRRKLRPSIDSRYFPATPAVPFWTSSALAGNPALAWTVGFELGRSVEAGVSEELRARCVR